jgi:hypothetical protein
LDGKPLRGKDRVVRRPSKRTEEAYVGWIRKFILFHGKRHPEDMGAPSAAMHPAGWRQIHSLIRWSLLRLPPPI